jgi:hypothetical protein
VRISDEAALPSRAGGGKPDFVDAARVATGAKQQVNVREEWRNVF